MTRCVLLKYGELALKGRNQWRFAALLRDNTRRAFRELGEVEVRQRAGVLVVVPQEWDDRLVERARDVLGISLLHPAVAVERDADAAARTAIELLHDVPGDATFAVRARRRDKRFPLNSQEIATLVGAEVQRALGLGVDVTAPDAQVHIEVDEREIFLYTERIRARGGLPVGISGHALVLLSGGIDSPVSAYRAMKRGLRCDFVHFSGRPHTGPESDYKAYAQVRTLDRFQGDSRLFTIPFGAAQRRLAGVGSEKLQILAQRRLMLRTASALAARERLDALVTGDSLGQVSSQTLPNLAAVEDATELPLLRPLIALDKAEIMDEARDIGTLAISELPAEDCCQMFASPRAETRARVDDLIRIDRLADAEQLVEELLAGATPLRPGDSPAREAA